MGNLSNIKNVVVYAPQPGDLVTLDAKNRINFISLDSFDKASMPKDTTYVGVVNHRQGGEIMVVNKESDTRYWADVYRWIVKGWKLDGAEHTTKISTYDPMPVPENPNFVYSGRTIDDIIPQFQKWLDAYSIQCKRTYSCEKKSDTSVLLTIEPHRNWYEYIFNMSGLTVSSNVAAELGNSYSTWAKNGKGDLYKSMCWEKFHSYMHDTTSSTFNPTEPLKELPSSPISYACYISEIGKFVRDIYGEGEAGYSEFLRGYEIVFPSQRGILAPKFRSGFANTYMYEAENYKSVDGTVKPVYPAFRYCADVHYDNPLMSRGHWYLPSMYELMKITPSIKMDYSDRVNRGLQAIGGKLLQLAGAWSSCRRGSGSAWCFDGWAGFSSDAAFYSQYWCWPCLLLNVNEVNKWNLKCDLEASAPQDAQVAEQK